MNKNIRKMNINKYNKPNDNLNNYRPTDMHSIR